MKGLPFQNYTLLDTNYTSQKILFCKLLHLDKQNLFTRWILIISTPTAKARRMPLKPYAPICLSGICVGNMAVTL